MSMFRSMEARRGAAVVAGSLAATIGAGALAGESSAGSETMISQAQMEHELGAELGPTMLEVGNAAVKFAKADHGAPRKDEVFYGELPITYPDSGHHEYEVTVYTKRDGRSYSVTATMDEPGEKPTASNLEQVQIAYQQDFADGSHTNVIERILSHNGRNSWLAGEGRYHRNTANKIAHFYHTTASKSLKIDSATGKPEYTPEEVAQKLEIGANVVKDMEALLPLALKGER